MCPNWISLLITAARTSSGKASLSTFLRSCQSTPRATPRARASAAPAEGQLAPVLALVPAAAGVDAARRGPGRHRVGDRDARAGPDRGHPLVGPLGGALLAGAVRDRDADRAVLVARDLGRALCVQVAVDVAVELVDVPGVPGVRCVA